MSKRPSKQIKPANLPVRVPEPHGDHGGTTTLRTIKTGANAGTIEARVTLCVPDNLLRTGKIWCIKNRTSLSAVFLKALQLIADREANANPTTR